MNKGRMDEEIRSMVWVDGVLYVGGPFSNLAGMKSRGIAQWDGSAWLPPILKPQAEFLPWL
ncbi:MAG: hypothetical protein GXY77_11650 [Fibrobacter sp.]|nr:hypothetical protein [Fibrobacter sp.]